jgi:sulfite reductase (NADPH) hemoprotein beta-component
MDRAELIGELPIRISGCINACGHHHLGAIGILGVDKKGEEYYQLSLGGSGDEKAALAQILGPAMPPGQIPDAIDAMVETYLTIREDGERFLDTVRRAGLQPFKEAVYVEAR